MNNIFKIIFSFIVSLIISFFIYFIINTYRYHYKIDLDNFKPYYSFFKDSIKKDIDTTVFVGCIRKNDALYHYIYKKDYFIDIWEFKELGFLDLNKITIYQNVNLNNIKFQSAEILNKGRIPEIIVRFGPFFKNKININTNENSKIENMVKNNNYKGFYGIINKMSFSNENGKHLVLIDYKDTLEYCLVLLLKKRNSFFIINISSNQPFNNSIYNILNLN